MCNHFVFPQPARHERLSNIPNALFVEAMVLSDLPVIVTGNLSLAEAISNKLPFIYIPVISENIMTSLALRLRAIDMIDSLEDALFMDDVLTAACCLWDGKPEIASLQVITNALTGGKFLAVGAEFSRLLSEQPSIYQTIADLVECIWPFHQMFLESRKLPLENPNIMLDDWPEQYSYFDRVSSDVITAKETIIQKWNTLPENIYRNMFFGAREKERLFSKFYS